jgi:DNA repair protein RadC
MDALNQVNNLHQVAEISIGYNPVIKPSQRPKVECSREVYEVLYNFWDKNTLELAEHFQVMLLSRANRVLGICTISKGGTAGTVVDAKLVFATALKGAAQSIIISHNHPSGNLKPSEQDKRLTAKLVKIGRDLDLPVLDHVIVTADGYYSFADYGEL